MSLVTQITTLTTRIAGEIKSVRTLINGNLTDLSGLTTSAKTNLVAALNELDAAIDTVSANAGAINDAAIATTTTWSSTKTDTEISAAVSALIAAAPGVLDTLNELAAALGDDPNFATTVTNSIATKQPLNTDLTAIAALVSAADKLPYATGAGAWSLTGLSAFVRTVLDDADAITVRATLGLGTAATTASTAYDAAGVAATAQAFAIQRANHTGTQLAATISDFGTAADARVVAGITGKQPLDASLTALAALVTAADKLAYTTGVDLWATTGFTSFARTLLDDIDAAAMRATLALGTAAITDAIDYDVSGAAAAAQAAAIQRGNHTGTQLAATVSDFSAAADARIVAASKQPLDASLTALAALVTAADKLAYATGIDAWATTTFTAFARTLLDDIDAPAMRTTLGLGTAATTASTAYDVAGAAATAQAAAVQRANHTGTQLATTISNFNATVQLMLDDLAWKIPVEAASTVNLTLTAAQTVDGVVLIVGDRVLVKDQTTNSQNGIYIVATGAWTRSTGTDTPIGLNGAQVTVKNGTTQMDTVWSQTATVVTINTSPVIWVRRPTMVDNTSDRARANHTGTQVAATISDFTAAADLRVVAGITGKQPLDASLTAFAALVTATDKLPYTTAADTWTTATLTAFARTLLDDIDAVTMRGTLGLGTAATAASTAFDAAA